MDGNQHASREPLSPWKSRLGWLASGVVVLVICGVVRWYWTAEPAAAQAPQRSAVKQASAIDRSQQTAPVPPQGVGTSAAAARQAPVAAVVNSEPITREELADECLVHYGTEVLDSIINRTLILVSCQRQGIAITDEQVNAEIERMAKKFQMGREQWLKVLEKERGITPDRYAQDIVWPTLALRELAKEQIKITRRELDEAYESEFGPGVKVRLIAIEKEDLARSVHAQAVADPSSFGALAKNHSEDSNSASAYGLIQPIRRHMGDPNLEAAAFALKKGEISQIVKVGNLHVFIKCEEHLPPIQGVDRAKVEPHLYDALREQKLRGAANSVFQQLQKEAKVENYYADPAKRNTAPGVAAVINGHQVSIRELSEECLQRFGDDVLEGTINRKMIDQALKKKNIHVGDADLQAEIARAAVAMNKVDEAGKPDVAGWIEQVTSTEGVTKEVYIRDEVWPSAALKKLVGDSIQVTPEDLQRGYEANYGPKVRCRAIVMNHQRRAQQVWDQCREALAKESKEGPPGYALKVFGDLAAEHSMEVASRSLRGEVPPIQRFGGQPVLEKEAFTLTEQNPLSGILQVGGAYVILLYEGTTKPVAANFEEVKPLLQSDIQEKKLRIAMARAFDELRDKSHIDNFMTGEVRAAKKAAPGSPDEMIEPGTPTPRVFKR
jgi:parvulin-like peptidyl-prolyl isomerase